MINYLVTYPLYLIPYTLSLIPYTLMKHGEAVAPWLTPYGGVADMRGLTCKRHRHCETVPRAHSAPHSAYFYFSEIMRIFVCHEL